MRCYSRCSLVVVASLALLLALPATAKRAKKKEQKAAATTSAASSTPWGKTFGLGLQLGAPTALTAKLKLENNTAVIFSIGGGWSWGLGTGLELSAGYVVHPSMIASYEALDLTWFVGGAVDVKAISGYYANTWLVMRYPGWSSSPIGLGAHLPIGLDFQLHALPLSIYLELDPGLDIFPYVGPRLGFALGARFFF